MLNVDNETITAFLTRSNLKKSVRIEIFLGPLYGAGMPGAPYEVTNTSIVAESLELEQHLCDGEGDFMGCVSSTFKISLMENYYLPASNAFKINNSLRVYIESETNEFESMLIFSGYIYEVTSSLQKKQIDLVCHDILSIFWDKIHYGNNLITTLLSRHSMTLGDILDHMMNFYSYGMTGYVGLNNCPNLGITITDDDMCGYDHNDTEKVIPNNFTPLDALRYICQLNGVYGIVNNAGNIEFRKYNTEGTYSGTYPSSTLTFPAMSLFPGNTNSATSDDFLYVPYTEFDSDVWERDVETPITGVALVPTSESTLYSYNYDIQTNISGMEYTADEGIIYDMEPGIYVYTCLSVEDVDPDPDPENSETSSNSETSNNTNSDTEESKKIRVTTWSPDGSSMPGNGAINISYVGENCKVGDSFTLTVHHKNRKVHIYNGSEVQDEYLGRFAIKVSSNPFLYNKEYSDRVPIGVNLYNNVSGYSYIKFEANGLGLPFVEVGDYVNYYVRDVYSQWGPDDEVSYEQKTCLILNRTLKGIQHMTDTYSAETYDYNHSDDAWEQTHFIDAMSGRGGFDETYKKYYEDNTGTTNESETSEEIDKKIEDAQGMWDVKSVDTMPASADARTIYFVRGNVVVEMREPSNDS